MRANLERRELDAHQNAQRWVSACLGLNLEILDAIGNATSSKEIAALVREVGDYDGPTALLRDTAAKYLKTGNGAGGPPTGQCWTRLGWVHDDTADTTSSAGLMQRVRTPS